MKDIPLADVDLVELIKHYPQRYERDVSLDSLEAWPANPKDHDIGAIVQSLEANGVLGVLLVQEKSRRILAGHGRREALRQLGITKMDCIFIDCPTPVARRFVLADNRTPQLGGFRDDALYTFLTDMQAQGESFVGTGYSLEDLDDLRLLLDPISFAQIDDDESQGELPYKAHEKITVLIRNVSAITLATKAIAELLAEHADWDAKIASA